MTLGALMTTLTAMTAPFESLPQNDCDTVAARHEVGVSLGGGLNIPAKADDASVGRLPGWHVGAAYDFRLNGHWAVGIGAELSSWRMETTNSAWWPTPNAVDKDGETYEHRTYLDNIVERQKLLLLDIPLRLSFQTLPSRPLRLEASAWVGLSITAQSNFETRNGTIRTEGFYPQYNALLYDMPINGFYTSHDRHCGQIDMKKRALAAGASVGIARNISQSVSIGLSAYAKHTLTDLKRVGDKRQYDPDCMRADGYADTRYNSIFETSAMRSARPVQIGVAATVKLSLGRKGRAERIDSPRRTPAGEKRLTPLRPYVDTRSHAGVLHAHIRPTAHTLRTEEMQRLVDQAGVIRFGLDGTALDDASATVATNIAGLLLRNGEFDVHITGHTCDIGTEATNKRIGLRRAQSVADALAEAGVEPSRISISSAGASQPIASNTTESGRRANRRVTIAVRRRWSDN